jgi:hypothetical protein
MIQPYVKHHVGLKSTIGTLFQGFLTHTHTYTRVIFCLGYILFKELCVP